MPTPNSGIPYVPENTIDPAAGINDSLRVIDALLQAYVIGFEVVTPPVSPADGDRYIVGAGATGAWATQDENMAQYVAEGNFWQFYQAGSQVHLVLYAGTLYSYDTEWVPVAGGGGGIPDAPEDGGIYARQDAEWVEVPGTDAQKNLTLITEASAFTVAPATHSGRDRLILAGGNVTFGAGIAGQCYNIRSTGSLSLVQGSGVTLTPTDGGTLSMTANMQVTVVMTSGTTGIVMGLTVAA